MNFYIGLPEWLFRTSVELIHCILCQFYHFQKSIFQLILKVTQDKSCKEDVLNETPMELVVANVMKFDIFLPLVVFGVAPRGFF